MIVIDDIELSKNIVDVKEVFIIRVLCHEEIAKWGDVKEVNWQDLHGSWNDVYKKIF